VLALASTQMLAESAEAAPSDPQSVMAPALYLTANPVDSMRTVCVSTTIGIYGGTWTWSMAVSRELDKWGRRETNYELGQGSYNLKVCLDPKDGHYVIFSELDPANPAWRTVRLVSQGFRIPESGGYSYYALLTPVRLG
jgi:hypothetical protein